MSPVNIGKKKKFKGWPLSVWKLCDLEMSNSNSPNLLQTGGGGGGGGEQIYQKWYQGEETMQFQSKE